MIRSRAHDAATMLALVAVFLLAPAASRAQEGQTGGARTRAAEEIDLEVQLHLLVGVNAGAANTTPGAKIPAALEPALRQLRSAVQVSNYRLAGTFLHRVRSGRNLEVKGVGGSLPQLLPAPNANSNPYTPLFYQFSMRPVELKTNAAGREVIGINSFNFGMKIPIAGGGGNTPGGNTTGGFPVIQYEDTGINTGLSAPEGEPVVVGTMYTGQGGDLIAVVLVARKVAPQ